MKLHITKLPDGMCGLCNPVALADFECECIETAFDLGVGPVGMRLTICKTCLFTMLAVAETGNKQVVEIDAEVAALWKAAASSNPVLFKLLKRH